MFDRRETDLRSPLCLGFTAPVKAGQELETSVWVLGERDGFTELAFEQTVVGGKKSIGGGYAQVRKVPAPTQGKL